MSSDDSISSIISISSYNYNSPVGESLKDGNPTTSTLKKPPEKNPVPFWLLICSVITTPVFVGLSNIDFELLHIKHSNLLIAEVAIYAVYFALISIALYLRSDCAKNYFNASNNDDRDNSNPIRVNHFYRNVFLYFIFTGILLSLLNIYLLPHTNFLSFKPWQRNGLSVVAVILLLLCPLLLRYAVAPKNQNAITVVSYVCIVVGVMLSILMAIPPSLPERMSQCIHVGSLIGTIMIAGILLCIIINSRMHCKTETIPEQIHDDTSHHTALQRTEVSHTFKERYNSYPIARVSHTSDNDVKNEQKEMCKRSKINHHSLNHSIGCYSE